MSDRTPEETRAYAEKALNAFYDAITNEESQEVQAALKRLINTNTRPTSKLRQIHIIADKAFRHATGRAACTRGCSHCCYIAVPITAMEAKAIGEQIGVEPCAVSNVPARNPMSFSNKTPCPFLKSDECSIYEHRPLECRSNFNFDRDSYWCRYENWDKPGAAVPKPMIPPIALAYSLVSTGKAPEPVIADIRDFFPNGKP
jgi:Fe-S-cluster containining protein